MFELSLAIALTRLPALEDRALRLVWMYEERLLGAEDRVADYARRSGPDSIFVRQQEACVLGYERLLAGAKANYERLFAVHAAAIRLQCELDDPVNDYDERSYVEAQSGGTLGSL